MILSKSIDVRSAINERAIPWEEVQQWFSRTFLNGEDYDVGVSSAEKLSPVAGAHRILTGAMSVLPIGVFQKKDGERHPVSDPDLDWVLKIRANDDMSPSVANKVWFSQEFWHGLGAQWIVRDEYARVKELIPLYTKGYSMRRDPETGQRWYSFVVDDTCRQFAPSELVISHFETYDGVNGRGILDLARETIAADGLAQRFGRKFYQNGARLSGIVEVDDDLKQPGRDRIKDEFTAYASADAYKVAVLDKGTKFTPLGISQSDAQFIESRGFSVAEMGRFTGIPEYMLQSGKQSYQSNEKQGLDFVTNTLMHHIVPKEQELTYKLLPRKLLLDGYYMRYNVGALLRGDNESRARFYEKMIMNSIYTPDDCRAFEEMNPLPNKLGQHFFMTKNLDTVEHIVSGEGKK